MDKTSNVRRQRQNTIKPSTPVRLDKCKRYHSKVRKLSAVVKASKTSDMGCDLSDGTREPSSVRDRLEISKRLFGDCNGVDHGSVPRKLRTAIKRRNRESTTRPSSDAKKRNNASNGFFLSNTKKSSRKVNGVQHPRKNGLKKSRLNKKKGKSNESLRKYVSGLLTKDEEEVAETLSAFAGMFPNSDCTRKRTLEVSETNSSTWPKSGKNFVLALEVSADVKLDSNLNASDSAKPPATFGDKTLKEKSGLPSRKQPRNKLDCSLPQLNLQTALLLRSNKPVYNEPLCMDPGRIMQPVLPDTSLAQRKPEFTLGLANANQCQLEQHYLNKSCKINGLYSGPSNFAGDCGTDMRHSSPRFPASQDAALCDAPRAFPNGCSSSEKNYIAEKIRKPWKRCETHVYISWLIKTLQLPERKDKLQMRSGMLKSDEGSNRVYFMGSALKTPENGYSTLGPTKSDDVWASGGHMKITEDGSDHLHHSHRELQDHKHPAGFNTLQKQGFDVLTFTSGTRELGSRSCSSSIPGKRQETPSHIQVPYFDSLTQQPSVPLNRYSSMAYPDKLSFPPVTQQTHLQLSPYLGSPLHTSPIALTKRHQQKQHYHQQQQQQLWAAQCRPMDASVATSQIQSWQYGGQDSHMLVSCSNSVLPAALKSGGLPCSMVNTVYQQQQKLMPPLASSLPPGMIKRPDSNPPLYEENGGGFCRTNDALPLQLL